MQLALAAVLAVSLPATAALSAPTCFSEHEVAAAHFRTLQQEFNIAALNCRPVDPNGSAISARYNQFVSKFGVKLQENARELRGHFARTGGNMDVWMTRVANHSGQQAVLDPAYCQRTSDILDRALVMDAVQLDSLAAETAPTRMPIAVCEASHHHTTVARQEPGKTTRHVKKTHAKAHVKAHAKPAEAKPGDAKPAAEHAPD